MQRSRSAAAAVAKDDDDAEGENLIPNDGGGSSVPGGYGATGNALQQETGEQRRARIRCVEKLLFWFPHTTSAKRGEGRFTRTGGELAQKIQILC